MDVVESVYAAVGKMIQACRKRNVQPSIKKDDLNHVIAV